MAHIISPTWDARVTSDFATRYDAQVTARVEDLGVLAGGDLVEDVGTCSRCFARRLCGSRGARSARRTTRAPTYALRAAVPRVGRVRGACGLGIEFRRAPGGSNLSLFGCRTRGCGGRARLCLLGRRQTVPAPLCLSLARWPSTYAKQLDLLRMDGARGAGGMRACLHKPVSSRQESSPRRATDVLAPPWAACVVLALFGPEREPARREDERARIARQTSFNPPHGPFSETRTKLRGSVGCSC